MKIAEIQQSISGCCAAVSSNTSNAVAWIGHNVQVFSGKTVDAAKNFGSAAWSTATKVFNVAMAYIVKGAMVTRFYAQVAWQGAKNLAGQSWEVLKAGSSKAAELAKIAGCKILYASKAALQATTSAATTVGNGIKNVASKVAVVASDAFAKTARVAKDAAIAGKNGLVQGFLASKTLIVAHRKETIIAGGILGIALAIGYAAKNVFNRPSAAVTI